MATVRFAGPGDAYARVLRLASRFAAEQPGGRLVRRSLLLIALMHVLLILSAWPVEAASLPMPLLGSLVTGLIVVALAIGQYPARTQTAQRDPVPMPAEPDHPPAEVLDLLARMNHDLRTPLNAVIGFSDLMHREMLGPLGNARYQEYARHIRDSGDVLLRATEDALAMTTLLAAPGKIALRCLALADVVEIVRNEVELAGSRAEVHGTGLDAIDVYADPDTLINAIRQLGRAASAHAGLGEPVAIETVVRDGRIDLAISTGEATSREGVDRHEQCLGRDALPLCLARVLLGLQDMTLSHACSESGWHATIGLRAAARPATGRKMFARGPRALRVA